MVKIKLYDEDDQDIIDYITKEAQLSFISKRDVIVGILRKHIRENKRFEEKPKSSRDLTRV